MKRFVLALALCSAAFCSVAEANKYDRNYVKNMNLRHNFMMKLEMYKSLMQFDLFREKVRGYECQRFSRYSRSQGYRMYMKCSKDSIV
ncbi:hypothetical protein H704_01070 [Bartonella bacilliformis Peru38]|uniref:Uncharacterized protein n=1 Tax=Bartonella bacilliformis INS TaxID=1206782 RepID=A0ABP2SLA0_BARBA|nr:hypothetical protein AL467_05595 [Bartonella bacilliformis]EKS43080.1 hypothetical protein BbINS_05587 [Bartonella bacilliformis INS]EYS89042.1 hypothetical protein X472_01132 [Bartonella bacilliformis San Pedro600-02]EYS95744.1 hypothetical protein X470_00335 [Bartonella bacilliformis Peru-18]KEG15929.1 hypothetical protein H709_01045 [Bartonella bacilliformis CUSCO5]KEG19358.1 hypothetical protein H704_01070 [Bartonella bacilliformis Peru38]KEG21547.1 hypothetical protein H703_01061 [Bar